MKHESHIHNKKSLLASKRSESARMQNCFHQGKWMEKVKFDLMEEQNRINIERLRGRERSNRRTNESNWLGKEQWSGNDISSKDRSPAAHSFPPLPVLYSIFVWNSYEEKIKYLFLDSSRDGLKSVLWRSVGTRIGLVFLFYLWGPLVSTKAFFRLFTVCKFWTPLGIE